MYQDFYGIKENPFRLTPDPQYLYLTRRYKEAMAQLFYGVSERKGFIVLIGEVGVGKTLLLNWMLETLAKNEIPSSYIFNSVMTPNDLFEYIATDFGLQFNANLKSQFLGQLYSLLIDLFAHGKTAVLIVDEAQNLSMEVLEELRLLTNLETGKEKLLQIVLSGQPELAHKLDHPSMRQLKQRIALRCMLKPLNLEETREYITARLKIAKLEGEIPFSEDAIAKIYEYSNGIPRIINNICDNALLAGFAYSLPKLDRSIIVEVGQDLQLNGDNAGLINSAYNAVKNGFQASAPQQLSYHLPPPAVPSGWKAYLSNLFHRFIHPMSRKTSGSV